MTDQERFEFLRYSIESHDRQIGELTDRVMALTANVEKLVTVSNRDGVDIAALARIAESHERRIGHLENPS
jgi:hypothetical protein